MPDQAAAIVKVTEWAAWFAWRPVRLYMSGKTVWLSWVFRRCVIQASGFRTCDYTMEPDEFPQLIPTPDPAEQRPG